MAGFPLALAVIGCVLLVLVLLAFVWMARRLPKQKPLPTEWLLTSRPVFSTTERRAHKLLREALPDHVVLAKLPLVRFCQPADPGEVRFWYDLLGATHVTFAICSPNGRVLAAIDLDSERVASRRVLQIKQSVLGACRIRYLRCSLDNLPNATELQLLVPSIGSVRSTGFGDARHDLDEARDSLASTVASRRAQRTALWNDSTNFHDSFFSPDSRLDGFSGSDFSTLASAALPPLPERTPRAASARAVKTDDEATGGIVVDRATATAARR